MSSIHREMRVWRLHLRKERLAAKKKQSQMPRIGEFIGE